MSNDLQKTIREHKLKIEPGDNSTLYFKDTTPNYAYIANPSASSLFVGVNGNVSPSTYDQIIGAYGADIYTAFRPMVSLTLFNSSEEVIEVVVKTWSGAFDPNALSKSMNISMMTSDGLLGVVDVNNVLSPLPVGENHIGYVSISGFDSPLPLGTAHIGSVTVEGIENPLPSGNEHIGRVTVEEISAPLPPGSSHIGNVTIQNSQYHGALTKILTGVQGDRLTIHQQEGIVFEVTSDNGNVILCNGLDRVWKPGDFKSDVGLYCDNSITVEFADNDTVYVLYKGMM